MVCADHVGRIGRDLGEQCGHARGLSKNKSQRAGAQGAAKDAWSGWSMRFLRAVVRCGAEAAAVEDGDLAAAHIDGALGGKRVQQPRRVSFLMPSPGARRQTIRSRLAFDACQRYAAPLISDD